MKIYELAKKQSSSLPGYQLINVFEAAFPVYRLNLSCLILTEQQIPVIEEYILKLLEVGIEDLDNIKGLLGLSESIIEDYLLDLLTQEIIIHEFINDQHIFRMTQKGQEILQKLVLTKPMEISVPLIFDALSGTIEYSRLGTYSTKKVEEMNLHPIHPYLPKPKLEDIELSQVRTIMKKLKKDHPEISPPDGELYDLTELEKIWIEYRKVWILVFYSLKDHDTMVQVFEKTQRVTEYEKVIMRMEREGIRVLPTQKKDDVFESEIASILKLDIKELQKNANKMEEAQEKIKILTKQLPDKQEIQDLEYADKATFESATKQLQEAKKEFETLKQSDRILSTYEHRPLLEQALKEAKKRITIISPWIKNDALDDELLSIINSTLQRKVEVHIGYGISQDKPHFENRATRNLKNLQSKPYGKYLKIYYLGNTHEKVLICDERYAIVTSFNWLSFKGSPERGFRQETGLFSQQHEVVQQLIVDINRRFSESTEVKKI